MLVGGFAHADVADCRRNQDPFGAFKGTQHDFNREVRAILPAAGKFDTCANLLSQGFGRGARAICDNAFGEAFRNEVFYFLADQFVAAVAELFFGLNVEKNDFSCLVDDYHRVRSCFEKPAVSALHLREVLLGILADGDVANCSGNQDAFGAFHWAQHDLDGEITPVFASSHELNSGADLLGQSFGCGSRAIRDQAFGETLRNNVLNFLPNQLIAAVSELFLSLDVEENYLPVLVHNHHGIGSSFQERAVLRTGFLGLADVSVGAEPTQYLSLLVAYRDSPGKEQTILAVTTA